MTQSRYTIGSSVRWNGAGASAPGGAPKTSPGINSIWLIGGEHNGYTIDYNAEAQFYGTCSSNRPELILPYLIRGRRKRNPNAVVVVCSSVCLVDCVFVAPMMLRLVCRDRYATVVLDYVAEARKESAYFRCPGGLHYPGAVSSKVALLDAHAVTRFGALGQLGPFGYYNFNWMHMHSHVSVVN
jgi:hypothetical protein